MDGERKKKMMEGTYKLDKKQNRKNNKITWWVDFARLKNSLQLLLSLSQTHCFCMYLTHPPTHTERKRKKDPERERERKCLSFSLYPALRSSLVFRLVLSWVSICKSGEEKVLEQNLREDPSHSLISLKSYLNL